MNHGRLGGTPARSGSTGHVWRTTALLCAAVLLALALCLALPRQAAATGSSGRWPAGSSSSQQLWEKVLADSKTLDPKSPGYLEGLFWTGVATANLGRIEDSRRAFQRLDAEDPGRSTGDRVTIQVDASLLQDPDDLQALNGLAFVAYARNDYAEAARVFANIARLDPRNPWVRAYLGFSLGKAGRIDEALKGLEEAVHQFPDNEILHFLLGMAYYQKGMILRAVVEMAKAPGAVRYFR